MTRRDLQRLAKMRLRDAQVLLGARRYAAAYYLCGYAVECALKACIAKRTKRHSFPPDRKAVEKLYSHDIAGLAKEAGLEADILAQAQSDSNFADNWAIVKNWSEQSRYVSRAQTDARDLVAAASDPQHGVIAWLEQHW